MKTCLNKKCLGNIKLLYDYGSNYDYNDIDFNCTTNSYIKPKIYICEKCKLKFSEFAININKRNIENKYCNVVDSAYINEISYKERYFLIALTLFKKECQIRMTRKAKFKDFN